ncbi:hypothetical protein RA210_U140075 [Rubrivivax sp. A210]|nr:hypothetical protein RA210_U140075 [Rubrivivax sp. A210]
MGGQLLRPARPGGPLAEGRTRPAPRWRPQGWKPPSAGAGHVLGIQRRAHQPALAGLAAPVPRTAAAGHARRAAATAGRAGHLPLGRLRRRLDHAGRSAPSLGSRWHTLGRRRDGQRSRPGPARPAAAGWRYAPGPGAAARGLGAPHGPAHRDRAVLRLAGVAEPRGPAVRGRIGRRDVHAGCRWPHGLGGARAACGGGDPLAGPRAPGQLHHHDGPRPARHLSLNAVLKGASRADASAAARWLHWRPAGLPSPSRPDPRLFEMPSFHHG